MRAWTILSRNCEAPSFPVYATWNLHVIFVIYNADLYQNLVEFTVRGLKVSIELLFDVVCPPSVRERIYADCGRVLC